MPKSSARPAKPGQAVRKGSSPRRAEKRPTVQARKPAARTRTRSPRPSIRPQLKLKKLSPERQMDLLGIGLALVGLLTLLSLISSQRSQATGLWLKTLAQVAGWGTYVLPLLLIGLGLWLILRNVNRLPVLSTERLTGLVLLYVDLLAWVHLIAAGGQPGGWQIAAAGEGGGYVGAVLEWLLVGGLGVPGAAVVLGALLIVSLVFVFDVSIPEVVRILSSRLKASRKPAGADAARPQERISGSQPTTAVEPAGTLAGFKPLNPREGGRIAQARTGSAGQSAGSAAGGQPAVGETEPGLDGAPAAAPSNLPPPAWVLPAADVILDPATPEVISGNADRDRIKIIEETLASFGAPVHVVEVQHGPVVTLFGVEPDFIDTRNGKIRVRVGKIAALVDDLALALAAPRIRIQAPVPGRGYVGIEVPNAETSRVALLEVMQSDSFQKQKTSLRFAIGKDVSGKPVAGDLSAMPHLLIAGTTGSGKSVCVNSILACFLMNNTPEQLRLVLVDPKRVELTGYNGIPHLLAPVITDAERVTNALQWILREMDSRYQRFSSVGARNIEDFNSRPGQHLPYLVVVIDELADLMMLAPDETERSIMRLAQLARATGIHLILATQRPSVNVVTGVIKANLPARIAFSVASRVDSQVILDQPGADRLLGRGDMLFQAPDAPAPVRLQGVYVSDNEIYRLVDYWRLAAANLTVQRAPTELEVDSGAALPQGVPLSQGALWQGFEPTSDEDPMLNEAIDLVRREGKASISMLQRKLRIGYTRAARMIDRLEEKGIVGPPQPATQVRAVLDMGDEEPPVED